MSAVSLLWLSPSMFLCYLVLLKARLKIPWLCKWALRRLKKGITELRWAIHIAAGKGEAFTAEHGLGWNVALFTNSSSKQLPGFRGYWSLGVTSVIHKIKNSCFHVSQALSFVLETECDTWNATSLLYCGLWSPPPLSSYNSSSMLFMPFFMKRPVFSTFGCMWESSRMLYF